MTDYGTDISSELVFQDGDLLLVNYNNNIIQAITNRLKTLYNNLDLFYDDYGSVLHDFMGWRRNEDTLNFMKIELDSCISKDPRITDYETELTLIPKGVQIDINIFNETTDETLELNYILSQNEGLELIGAE